MTFYNLLHGLNPMSPLYLAMLGFEFTDVPRFRDVHLKQLEGGKYAIAIYTRMGGGNRGHWDFASYGDNPGPGCPCPGCRADLILAGHPLYLYDEDDDFDSTYATYYFRVPAVFEAQVAEFAALGGQKEVPAETWKRTISKLRDLKPGEDGDEETKRWMEVGRPIVEQVLAAFRASDHG